MRKTGGEPFDEKTLIYLRSLSAQYPTIDSALAESAALRARLTLPKETIHVISDVHGEYKKLKHVVNNASGSLRPLVDAVFGDRLTPEEKLELLNFVYYPRESYAHAAQRFTGAADRRTLLKKLLRRKFELARRIVRRYGLADAEARFPKRFLGLFRELLFEPDLGRDDRFFDSLIDPFLEHGKDMDLLRHASHLVRDLLISELVVAGDLGDRGPRIDRVIDFLMRQPAVTITWGNHDMSWMAACLGHVASIATVLRISLRYRRLSQLEEGYGIPASPLEKLARTVYADDPAEQFPCKGEGLRDGLLMARMQKAIAVIQFKLEGQLIRRNLEFELDHRNFLHTIDLQAKTATVDGKKYPILDARFPTVDWSDPYTLSPEEESCVTRLKASFLQSPALWGQMQFVAKRGSMFVRRDLNLIFHGCVPVDESGNFLALKIDGADVRGRELFEVLTAVVHRAFREKNPADLDLLWYLWAGPKSPVFGKDRMATFEGYFIAEKAAHKETKNPYFNLIHDRAFCRKILVEFGIDPEEGLLVNGHVPVKVEKGESPVKKSGCAVTIDGAFSEAYGDKGYTLVLDADRTYLATHSHFESVEEAVMRGADIIPTVQDVKVFKKPRTVGDTEKGEELSRKIEILETLIRAYRESAIPERVGL